MATLIKVEPDSDNETGPLSQQPTAELSSPDEEGRSAPFTFVPVQTQIKVGYLIYTLVFYVTRWSLKAHKAIY
jgi:hypothetical protein